MSKGERGVYYYREEARIRRDLHALEFPNFHYDSNVKNKIPSSDKERTRGMDLTSKGMSKRTTKLPRKKNPKEKKGIKAGQDGRSKVSTATREGYNVFHMEFDAPLPIAPGPQSSEFESPSQSQSQPEARTKIIPPPSSHMTDSSEPPSAILGWEDSLLSAATIPLPGYASPHVQRCPIHHCQ